MSLNERPCDEKLEMRPLIFDAGDGKSVLAFEKLAVLESLLPSFTSQFGPPSYIFQNVQYEYSDCMP